MASVTDLYSNLQGQRVRESERVTVGEREKTIKTRGVYVSEIQEEFYVCETTEEKNLTF